MFEGYRVVAVTPAGRQKYLEILAPYILKCDYVDEWRLWINTTNAQDIEYMRQLEKDQSGRVRLEYGDPAVQVDHGLIGYSIYQYYRNCCDPNTIYIRFDDDICYVAMPAIHNLLVSRLVNRHHFLVFAHIINNAIISHLYQRFGFVIYKDIVSYQCMDPIGWGDPYFAEVLHRNFFVDGPSTKFPDWDLNVYERFSVNCFAFFGKDFAEFGGNVGKDEEVWLSVVRPVELGRSNLVCSAAVVVHFAFYTQRAHLESTGLLEQYRKISQTGITPWN